MLLKRGLMIVVLALVFAAPARIAMAVDAQKSAAKCANGRK